MPPGERRSVKEALEEQRGSHWETNSFDDLQLLSEASEVSQPLRDSLALPTLHIPIGRYGRLEPRLCKRFCNLMMTFVTYREPQASSQANLLIRLLESGGLSALGWGNPLLHSFLPAP